MPLVTISHCRGNGASDAAGIYDLDTAIGLPLDGFFPRLVDADEEGRGARHDDVHGQRDIGARGSRKA